MQNNYTILLTGCIDPKGMIYTALTDKQQRRQQYVDAIRFYLKATDLPVVFCENTMSEITKNEIDQYLEGNRFESITFNGNNFDKSLGKGYGECEIMQYAYNHSRLIKRADYVVKITGRIIVSDITSLLSAHAKAPTTTVQATSPNIETKSIDSRIIIAPKDFYTKYFLPRKEELNDSKGVFFEHLLYSAAMSQTEYYFIPFTNYPHFEGISGSMGGLLISRTTSNALYYRKTSCTYIVKDSCRKAARKLLFSTRCKGLAILLETYIQLTFHKITLWVK